MAPPTPPAAPGPIRRYLRARFLVPAATLLILTTFFLGFMPEPADYLYIAWISDKIYDSGRAPQPNEYSFINVTQIGAHPNASMENEFRKDPVKTIWLRVASPQNQMYILADTQTSGIVYIHSDYE